MLALRAMLLYVMVILLLRFLGHSLQFQSRPYDSAVQALIGAAAGAFIVTPEVKTWEAFLALGALVFLHTAISYLALWNPTKRYLVGEPVALIENGRFLKANLIKHQISVDEVLASLREKGYFNPADVEFAFMEASGKLSVIPRSQSRPLTPRDLGLPTDYEGLAVTLIVDGRVDKTNLAKAKLSPQWLQTELLKRGIEEPKQVLLATLDTQGQLFVVQNQDVPFLKAVLFGLHTQTSPGLPPLLGPAEPDPSRQPQKD